MNPTGSDKMTSLYDILKANRLGMNHDYWVAMLGKTWKASKEKYKEYTGLVPYTFKANGEPLLDWRINGNTGGVGDKTSNLVPAITDNSWVPGWFDGGIVKPATSYKEKTSDFIELSGDLQTALSQGDDLIETALNIEWNSSDALPRLKLNLNKNKDLMDENLKHIIEHVTANLEDVIKRNETAEESSVQG